MAPHTVVSMALGGNDTKFEQRNAVRYLERQFELLENADVPENEYDFS